MGHEVSVGVNSYNYREPGDQAISIYGPKITAAYTVTTALNPRTHWFLQANLRGVLGSVTYDGWCAPFFIAPNKASPNAYELGLGDYSPCSESGDRDWYLEGRALAGKDVMFQQWALSPYSGVGLRHLSNGTTGVPDYRTDNYLYLPLGVTARTNLSDHALSATLEVDSLVHGWQTTRDSELGGGLVSATTTAPAFTIDGFTDVSFAQSTGWGVRVSAKCQVTPHWSVEPEFVRWRVSASPVNHEVAAFTVNGATAQEQFGAYEPDNNTNEFGVKLSFRF